MSTIIRSVHNNLALDITLSHINITLPASTTVDLYTLATDVELLQIQDELAQMVTSGSISVVASSSDSELLGGHTSIKGSLTFTDIHADIGTVGAATPQSTIFTPTVTGMYLLSFYGLATVSPSGADAAPNLYMKWTDERGLQTYFNFAGNLDQTFSDGPNSVSIPIYAVAGQPIWMATSAGNYTGTVRWNFHFSVTQI